MQALTARQEAVLDFISEKIRTAGYPPTVREIGAGMGIGSTNGVTDHLRALERKGYIERVDLHSRGIRLTNKLVPGAARPAAPTVDPSDVVAVRVYSRIVASDPAFLPQNVAAVVRVGSSMVAYAQPENVFGFLLLGSSMEAAGLLAGDVLFFVRQPLGRSGDLACVLVGEEAIVRHVHVEREHVRLQPAPRAPGVAPILVRREDFAPEMLLGVAVGMLRRVAPQG